MGPTTNPFCNMPWWCAQKTVVFFIMAIEHQTLNQPALMFKDSKDFDLISARILALTAPRSLVYAKISVILKLPTIRPI